MKVERTLAVRSFKIELSRSAVVLFAVALWYPVTVSLKITLVFPFCDTK